MRRRRGPTYPALSAGSVTDHATRQAQGTIYGYAAAPRPAPIPQPTWAPRASLTETFNRNHRQYILDPTWGYRGNRYPRFSFIGLIGASGHAPTRVTQQFRPQPRFTRVLRYPRRPATPGVYGQPDPGAHGPAIFGADT
jgi:hypothetical protein